MKILALELSSSQRSVAALASDPGVPDRCAERTETDYPGRPLALAAAVLADLGIDRRALDVLAVGLGPGSYTGIRGAISLVQGWHLAAEPGAAPALTGIGTMEVLAEEARDRGLQGEITLVVDAQRGEFYRQVFQVTADGFTGAELKIVPASEITAALAEGRRVFGPDIDHKFPGSRALHPGAAALARLARRHPHPTAPEALQPIYLREISFVKVQPLFPNLKAKP